MSPPKPPHRDHTPRRRTEPLGVDTSASPVEVDPELTPPPRPPPDPEQFETLDMREQIRALHAVSMGNAAGIERVWGARHDDGRLDRMENRLDRAIPNLERAVAVLDHWVPQLQTVMATSARQWDEHTRSQMRFTTFLEAEWPRTQKTIDGVAKTLDDIIGRLGRVEHGQQEMTRNHGAMDAQMRSVQNIQNSHDVRLTALEQRNRDHDNQAKGGELVVAKATKWASAIKGVVGAAVVAIAWLVSKLLD